MGGADEEEIEYLEAFKHRTDDLELAAAMQLRQSRSEFEEMLSEAPRKVAKILRPCGREGKVGKLLNHDGDEVVQSLQRSEDELVQEQTMLAHAAIAGRTSFTTLRDPKTPNPGAPAGRDLDF